MDQAGYVWSPGLAKGHQRDRGKQKDVAEKSTAWRLELPELVKEALHARHELHDHHVGGP